MDSDVGMWVVGTIRTIELHTVTSKFEGVPARQVSKIALEIERAQNGDGTDIDIQNLAGLSFQGPPELVPRFTPGDRVQISTSAASGVHIASIKPAPLS
jgi:hypothetical protein